MISAVWFIHLFALVSMTAIAYRIVIVGLIEEIKHKTIDNYVIIQDSLIFAVIVLTPFLRINLPFWVTFLGLVVYVLGSCLLISGYLALGTTFTPSVKPKDDGQLITRGIFSKVRHPMYGGAILVAIGWSLLWSSPFSFAFSIALIPFFMLKARHEEELLNAKYTEYQNYSVRVKKMLIPFIF